MRYNLFLDDIRTPTSDPRLLKLNSIYTDYEWMIARSYDEFTTCIKKFGLPTIVSFDHDLSNEHIKFYEENLEGLPWEEKQMVEYHYERFKEKTGYDAAKWLVDYCLDNGSNIPTYLVHSANPVGRENITALLEHAKRHIQG